jgi:hypothetical protein
MPAWIALVLSPTIALACQSAMFSLVTPSCSVQTRIALHAVAALSLAVTVALTLHAWRGWSARSGVSATPDGEGHGPVETRRFLDAAATAVSALASLLVLMMWIAACVLSPCW